MLERLMWGCLLLTLVYGKAPQHKLVEGDIQVPLDAGRQGRALGAAGNADRTRLWPGGRVNYHIAVQGEQVQWIQNAVAHWEQKTCIRFSRCTNEASCSKPYITFVRGSTCSSTVGISNERVNRISLSGDCREGVIIHEIGHSLGLAHEQSRNDRDNYVSIDFSQVPRDLWDNFKKTDEVGAGRDIGPYDYSSIMHYGSHEFVPDTMTGPSIVSPKRIGQRNGLSAGDVESINFMYNGCSSTYPTPICIASAEPSHIIPYGSKWSVEINAEYSSSMRVSFGPTTAPGASFSHGNGAMTSPSARVRISFTPSQAQAGSTFVLGAAFSGTGSTSTTCQVTVKVAAASAVCFGIASNDPQVCSGRGRCTNHPLRPCVCSPQYAGLTCAGLADCPENHLISFDTFGDVSRQGDATIDTPAAVGSGALHVKNGGFVVWKSSTKTRARRISFHVSWIRGDPQMQAASGSARCFALIVQGDALFLVSEGAGRQNQDHGAVQIGAGQYVHVELNPDWAASPPRVTAVASGKSFSIPMASGCQDGIDAITFLAEGQSDGRFDELQLQCTDVAPPSPVTVPTPTTEVEDEKDKEKKLLGLPVWLVLCIGGGVLLLLAVLAAFVYFFVLDEDDEEDNQRKRSPPVPPRARQGPYRGQAHPEVMRNPIPPALAGKPGWKADNYAHPPPRMHYSRPEQNPRDAYPYDDDEYTSDSMYSR